ncbi:hypothetical protein [Thermococcus nautili]|uniref:Uncharacterized protein n=1 Tax=Thermococcus nautili TaxID=195522 RepID=W8P5S9_9EURY|nr:hypothetical protein [Thermococcus nautili]AHL22855.1 hypothetical protein BD01_1240 [Thermococcus nautili]
MDWIKLLPHEEGVEKIGKEVIISFVFLFWLYMVVMWALSKGIVVNPREFFGGITHPRALIEAFTAVILVLVVRRLRGDKPSPYRYGWILTVVGMFMFPFVSLTRSQLVATLFFILWYYLVIWTFSWEAAPKKKPQRALQ